MTNTIPLNGGVASHYYLFPNTPRQLTVGTLPEMRVFLLPLRWIADEVTETGTHHANPAFLAVDISLKDLFGVPHDFNKGDRIFAMDLALFREAGMIALPVALERAPSVLTSTAITFETLKDIQQQYYQIDRLKKAKSNKGRPNSGPFKS